VWRCPPARLAPAHRHRVAVRSFSPRIPACSRRFDHHPCARNARGEAAI